TRFSGIEIRHHLSETPSPSGIRGTNQAAIVARKKDGKTRPRIGRRLSECSAKHRAGLVAICRTWLRPFAGLTSGRRIRVEITFRLNPSTFALKSSTAHYRIRLFVIYLRSR